MRHVAGIYELARDAGHVVVPEERLRYESVQQLAVPLQCPGELVEVAVVQRAPRRLPQLVLRHRVHAGLGHEARVVAVDDLAQQPRVRMLRAHPIGDLPPESGGHRIGGIEPPTRCAALQPVGHHVADVVHDLRFVVVQSHQMLVALEAVERTVRPAAEPCRERRLVAVLQHVGQRGKAAPDMVEDAVEHDLDASARRLLEQLDQVLLGAESWVYAVVVHGVVAVGLGREDGTEQQTVRAQAEDVVQPVVQLPEPRCRGARVDRVDIAGHVCCGLRSPEKAERVDVPEDRGLRPMRHAHTLGTGPEHREAGRSGGC